MNARAQVKKVKKTLYIPPEALRLVEAELSRQEEIDGFRIKPAEYITRLIIRTLRPPKPASKAKHRSAAA